MARYRNRIYEWEGDTTQPYPADFTFKTKRLLLPQRSSFNCARVVADTGNRETYYESLSARQAAIDRNNEMISAGVMGGSISEDLIGASLSVNGDNLVDVPVVGAYSGAFNLLFKLYVDGVLKFTKDVYASGIPFRIPGGFRGRSFEIQIEGNVNVRRVDMASAMSELASLGG